MSARPWLTALLALAGCVPKVTFTDADFRGGDGAEDARGDAAEDASDGASDAGPFVCERGAIAELRVGDGASCAVRRNGNVLCWGNARAESETLPPREPWRPRLVLQNASDITVEHDFWCAISSNDVKCWGANDRGQLGVPMDGTRPRLERVALEGRALSIGSSESHVCAVVEQGSNRLVYCWGDGGDNRTNRVMPPARTEAHTPFKIDGLNSFVQRVVLDGWVNFALSHDSLQTDREWTVMYGWGRSEPGRGVLPNQVSSVVPPTRFGPIRSAMDPAAIATLAVSPRHACAIVATDSSGLWCIGDTDTGALGSLSPPMSADPVWQRVPNAPPDVALVAVGGFESSRKAFTCFASPSRRSEVLCFGSNELGQLGTLAASNASEPQSLRLPSDAGAVTRIAASAGHVCALTEYDRVFCWGRNCEGESGVANGAMAGQSTCPAALNVRTPTEVFVPCE
jgi:alpha-tubulin suppressor-like RCC1 family protein